METNEIGEKLINNLKRERTLFKNGKWNDGEQKRKSGENALNIRAARRSHRIHSILFCLLSKAKTTRKEGSDIMRRRREQSNQFYSRNAVK